jgi:hypothetical protein
LYGVLRREYNLRPFTPGSAEPDPSDLMRRSPDSE